MWVKVWGYRSDSSDEKWMRSENIRDSLRIIDNNDNGGMTLVIALKTFKKSRSAKNNQCRIEIRDLSCSDWAYLADCCTKIAAVTREQEIESMAENCESKFAEAIAYLLGRSDLTERQIPQDIVEDNEFSSVRDNCRSVGELLKLIHAPKWPHIGFKPSDALTQKIIKFFKELGLPEALAYKGGRFGDLIRKIN